MSVIRDYCCPQRVVITLLLCVLIQSCASYGQRAYSLRDGLLMGRPDLSLSVAEDKDPEMTDVITSLDKGMLRRMNGDYKGSNEALEAAKKEIEKLYGISITENLASLTVNDTLRGYEGDRYEQLLLHVFKAQNYIQLGQLDDARVEMLQANVKMMEWGDEPEEDPYLRYFEGIIYEALKEYDNALISYRKAFNRYRETAGKVYPETPLSLKKDLLRLLAWQGLRDEFRTLQKQMGLDDYEPYQPDDKYGELIVIVNNGLAPIRSQSVIPIFSTEVQGNLRVAFPIYREPKKNLLRPVIQVTDKRYAMDTVEDVDALARHSLEQDMPAIMARATARAVVKYNTQHQAQDNSPLAGFLMTVTNLVSEQADTRSWSTLPQEIELQRIRLPVGEYNVAVQMVAGTGSVVDSMRQQVIIKPRSQSFVIRHWVAPVQLPVSKPATAPAG
jgi:hypothetical protein